MFESDTNRYISRCQRRRRQWWSAAAVVVVGAAAGSLLALAKYPASTIQASDARARSTRGVTGGGGGGGGGGQILGAEKALFRALKTKASTPKYGSPGLPPPPAGRRLTRDSA